MSANLPAGASVLEGNPPARYRRQLADTQRFRDGLRRVAGVG